MERDKWAVDYTGEQTPLLRQFFELQSFLLEHAFGYFEYLLFDPIVMCGMVVPLENPSNLMFINIIDINKRAAIMKIILTLNISINYFSLK
jgi:hypothetical protein